MTPAIGTSAAELSLEDVAGVGEVGPLGPGGLPSAHVRRPGPPARRSRRSRTSSGFRQLALLTAVDGVGDDGRARARLRASRAATTRPRSRSGVALAEDDLARPVASPTCGRAPGRSSARSTTCSASCSRVTPTSSASCCATTSWGIRCASPSRWTRPGVSSEAVAVAVATPGDGSRDTEPARASRPSPTAAARDVRPLRRRRCSPATRCCTPSASSSTWARSTRACTACCTCGSRSRARSSSAPRSRTATCTAASRSCARRAPTARASRCSTAATTCPASTPSSPTCSALEELAGHRGRPPQGRVPPRALQRTRAASRATTRGSPPAAWTLGALTPFLYAFTTASASLDVFEAVTGGRMMFNYFRPGGVKDDLPPGIAER